ncbi:MAG TPA: thiamine phosphate synthase [Pyrinomonadaceae bacterium]|nr:thiamine phosphate synthase [Pyrinomonadaceae bacterium]
MPLDPPTPIIYPITSGATTAQITSEDQPFLNILQLLRAAVAAEVPLFQIREKALHARVLYELTARAAEITRGSKTRLLVNDRSDIARAAGADGVQLTAESLPPSVVRQIYGPEFLIGVSTHSFETALAASKSGADFVVFGPVFETESKRAYGAPQGLQKLRVVADELRGFPVIAIGGITIENAASCFAAGASGIAAIRLLNDAANLASIVEKLRDGFNA